MAEMGSLGGKIGGKKRAEKMTAEARRASASLAARSRWNKNRLEESSQIRRDEGLRKIAQILEDQMTEMGLSEEEKNARTEALVEIVKQAIAVKTKAASKSEEPLHIAASQA
jgi:hypothetical protein